LLQTGSSLENVGYQAEYEKERSSSLLDMINLIYVAFTRPAERLYVIAREPAKAESINLPGLLHQYIESNSDEWIQNGAVFTKGIDDIVQRTKKPADHASLLSEMISTPWQGRIKIARRAPVYWSADQSNTKQAWGTLIHDTLAVIRTKADVSDRVNEMATSNLLSPDETEILRARVTATIDHDELCRYFHESVQIKPEAGILTPKGEVFRPDRVIFSENETVIMEFKTGLPKPDHEKQLHNYGEILNLMGYPGIRKLLVYLDEKVLVKEL